MSAQMVMVATRDPMGGIRHVMAPASAVAAQPARGKKKRFVPDPMRTMSGNAAAEQLRLFIERIERLDEEIKGVQDDRKDVLSEAKANGYDTKILNQIVKLRKMETHDRQESEALLETYKASLGID